MYVIYNVMINNLCDEYNFFEKNLYFNKIFYLTNKYFKLKIEYLILGSKHFTLRI
jgi:hypothetical protein